jgi:hypothetical protein
MKKIILNVGVTILAIAILVPLFYIGYQEATRPAEEATDRPCNPSSILITEDIEETALSETEKNTENIKENIKPNISDETDAWQEDDTLVEMSAGDYLVSDSGDEVVFLKYSGDDNCVILPTEYKGKPITSVADGAFTSSTCKVVSIPKSYKKIADRAFCDNATIEEVIIGDGVEEIGNSAFAYCRNLNTVTGGRNIKTIKAYAFSGCKKLKNINFNFENIEIGNKVFDETEIKV